MATQGFAARRDVEQKLGQGNSTGTRVSEQGLPRSSGKAKSCFSCVSSPRDKENALVIILALGKVLLKDVKCQTGGLAVS